MNPNIKVHAAVKLNGSVTHWDQTELRLVPMMLARLILDSDLTPQQFSTLELRIGKRPVSFATDSADVELEGLLGLSIQVEDSHTLPGHPHITYGELHQLESDPVWTTFRDLRMNPDKYQGVDATNIRIIWEDKYKGTKFAALMGG